VATPAIAHGGSGSTVSRCGSDSSARGHSGDVSEHGGNVNGHGGNSSSNGSGQQQQCQQGWQRSISASVGAAATPVEAVVIAGMVATAAVLAGTVATTPASAGTVATTPASAGTVATTPASAGAVAIASAGVGDGISRCSSNNTPSSPIVLTNSFPFHLSAALTIFLFDGFNDALHTCDSGAPPLFWFHTPSLPLPLKDNVQMMTI